MTPFLLLTNDHALERRIGPEFNRTGVHPVIHHRGEQALHALAEGSFPLFWIKEAPPDIDLPTMLTEARRMSPWTLLCLSDTPDLLRHDLPAPVPLHTVPSPLQDVPEVLRNLLSTHKSSGSPEEVSPSLLRLFRELPERIAEATDDKQTWLSLLSALSVALESSASSVLLKQGNDWKFLCTGTPPPSLERQRTLRTAACSKVWSLLGQRPVIIGDSPKDECVAVISTERPDDRVLTLPVWSESGLAGILSLMPESSSPVGEAGMALLYQVVHLVQKLRHQQYRLREMANRDPLTGCFNRRCLEETCHALRLSSRQAHRSMAVLFIDLNEFKEINDQFGHQVGDQVLKAFARFLRSLVEDPAAVFRLGGDEFLVLKGSTDPDEVRLLGTRISTAFSETVLLSEPENIRVPVSVGMAVHGPDDLDTPLETFLREADRDLYRTKMMPAPEQSGA